MLSTKFCLRRYMQWYLYFLFSGFMLFALTDNGSEFFETASPAYISIVVPFLIGLILLAIEVFIVEAICSRYEIHGEFVDRQALYQNEQVFKTTICAGIIFFFGVFDLIILYNSLLSHTATMVITAVYIGVSFCLSIGYVCKQVYSLYKTEKNRAEEASKQKAIQAKEARKKVEEAARPNNLLTQIIGRAEVGLPLVSPPIKERPFSLNPDSDPTFPQFSSLPAECMHHVAEFAGLPGRRYTEKADKIFEPLMQEDAKRKLALEELQACHEASRTQETQEIDTIQSEYTNAENEKNSVFDFSAPEEQIAWQRGKQMRWENLQKRIHNAKENHAAWEKARQVELKNLRKEQAIAREQQEEEIQLSHPGIYTFSFQRQLRLEAQQARKEERLQKVHEQMKKDQVAAEASYNHSFFDQQDQSSQEVHFSDLRQPLLKRNGEHKEAAYFACV